MSYRDDLKAINAALNRLEPGRCRNIENSVHARAEKNQKARREKELAYQRLVRWRQKHRRQYNKLQRQARMRRKSQEPSVSVILKEHAPLSCKT